MYVCPSPIKAQAKTACITCLQPWSHNVILFYEDIVSLIGDLVKLRVLSIHFHRTKLHSWIWSTQADDTLICYAFKCVLSLFLSFNWSHLKPQTSSLRRFQLCYCIRIFPYRDCVCLASFMALLNVRILQFI